MDVKNYIVKLGPFGEQAALDFAHNIEDKVGFAGVEIADGDNCVVVAGTFTREDAVKFANSMHEQVGFAEVAEEPNGTGERT